LVAEGARQGAVAGSRTPHFRHPAITICQRSRVLRRLISWRRRRCSGLFSHQTFRTEEAIEPPTTPATGCRLGLERKRQPGAPRRTAIESRCRLGQRQQHVRRRLRLRRLP
jgi:hypothetical protein